MRFFELQKTIQSNLFTFLDMQKNFEDESAGLIKIQLSRFAKKGYIFQIKRGLYSFDLTKIDELQLANVLYQPSYVSLETALNYHGIIPDVTQNVTSVTVTTSKKIKILAGNFSYSKINQKLFFGWTSVKNEREEYFKIARPEKALLDYFYVRKITSISDLRLSLKNVNMKIYMRFRKEYPEWVQKIHL